MWAGRVSRVSRMCLLEAEIGRGKHGMLRSEHLQISIPKARRQFGARVGYEAIHHGTMGLEAKVSTCRSVYQLHLVLFGTKTTWDESKSLALITPVTLTVVY